MSRFLLVACIVLTALLPLCTYNAPPVFYLGGGIVVDSTNEALPGVIVEMTFPGHDFDVICFAPDTTDPSGSYLLSVYGENSMCHGSSVDEPSQLQQIRLKCDMPGYRPVDTVFVGTDAERIIRTTNMYRMPTNMYSMPLITMTRVSSSDTID